MRAGTRARRLAIEVPKVRSSSAMTCMYMRCKPNRTRSLDTLDIPKRATCRWYKCQLGGNMQASEVVDNSTCHVAAINLDMHHLVVCPVALGFFNPLL